MTYMDTSSLLKLLLDIEECHLVHRAISTCGPILISSITFLEGHVQLKARILGGIFKGKVYEEVSAKLDDYRFTKPFTYKIVPGSVFERGVLQVKDPDSVYLRSMDRLHLAAMEELRVQHLLTNDLKQAEAAREMGYLVMVPG